MVSNFVPAQNSRHRTAALALYRALVREGKKVQLPPDVQQPSRNHPVAHLVRKRFAKNKAYTSFRLTYAALAAGYNVRRLLMTSRLNGSLLTRANSSSLSSQKHARPTLPSTPR